MADERVVLVTVPSREEGERIAEILVGERLAACVNIVGPIRSIYRWEGAVHDEPEARVALHTRASLVERIVARADAEHPYDVPCVLALPVAGGNPAYLEWVLAMTDQRG